MHDQPRDQAAEEERKQIFAQCCEEEEKYLLKHGGVLFPKLEETLKKLFISFQQYLSLQVLHQCSFRALKWISTLQAVSNAQLTLAQ